MTLKEYMDQTEFAVRQLFQSLKHYQNILDKAKLPGFIYYGSDDVDYKKKGEEFFNDPNVKLANNYANKKLSELQGLKYSQAVICGSILQIANMAVSLFSKYDGACPILTGKHKKFVVGKLVNNVPLGLIIYAARNQYNHWDEEESNKYTKGIFDLIATRNQTGDYKDPCFDLDCEFIDIYSHNIFGLIGWKTFEDYEKDIIDMLIEYTE